MSEHICTCNHTLSEHNKTGFQCSLCKCDEFILPERDQPYYVYEFETQDFYCHHCNKWHWQEKIKAYNVCVAYTSMPQFISCNKDYCQDIVNQFNIGHLKAKRMSLAQGHKALLL